MTDEYVTHAELEGFYNRVREIGDGIHQELRTPSKARLIGAGHSFNDYAERDGAFITALIGLSNRDPDVTRAAKATLTELGSRWSDVPSYSKATLGNTDAAGGWIVPNALVDSIVKPARYKPGVLDLVTIRTGVTGAAVDIPYRTSAPAAAVIAAFGATKENVDLAYNGYTATMAQA